MVGYHPHMNRLPFPYLILKHYEQCREEREGRRWVRRELLLAQIDRLWRRLRGLDPDEIEL
jgi:hypothetical protein